MSAVEAIEPLDRLPPERKVAATPQRQRPRLRLLAAPSGHGDAQPVARLPFALMLLAVLALGMGLLVIVNTQIQTRASELAALEHQASQLTNQKAQLQTEVNQKRSASSLQVQAHRLGMRPNPKPAFIVLASGQILGTPTKVNGNELPHQVYLGWEQTQQAQEDSRAAVAREKAEEARKAEDARKAREAKLREQQKQQLEKQKAEQKKAAEKKPADPTTSADPKKKPNPGGN